jgi:hypothetical protein
MKERSGIHAFYIYTYKWQILIDGEGRVGRVGSEG